MILSFKKFKRNDMILLIERLELYISSGLAIDKAFVVSEDGLTKGQIQTVRKIKIQIESGVRLAKSMKNFLPIPETICGLIENGQASGKLSEALNSSKNLLEREDELKRKCLSAMTYPIVIGVFAILLTLGLVKGVLPQITPVLKGLHVELPLLTKIVIQVSDLTQKYGLYFVLILILVFFVWTITYTKIKFIRKFFQTVLIHWPILGKLFYLYSLALFLRTCGSLIESGLPSAEAYQKASQTLSLIPLNISLSQEVPAIFNGKQISSVIRQNSRIPRFIPALMSAGEISGNLGQSFLRAASILDRNIEQILKKITSLIEPAMMMALGLMIGLIAISIMMPIYDISKVLQK